MKSFLQTLLEGADSTAKVDITTNEEVEKEVNESCLPMDMLIESVSTDITIGLNRAVEVYEMACIVGGVKVVQEGTGQEGAAELLTEASDNFFSKILEKIKKIKDWFVAMIKKIGNKIASLFTNIDKAWAKYEADYRKNFEAGKFKFTGHIIDLNAGDDFFTSISEASKECIGEISDKLDDPSKMTEEEAKEMTVENLFKMVSEAIGEEVENSAEVTAALKKVMKVDKESKEITVSAEDSDTMTNVIIAATKDGQKTLKASTDLMVSSCNMLVKRVEATKKQNGDNAIAVKYCTNAVTILNTISSVLATLVNIYSTSIAQAAKAYIGFVTKVAQGKGVTESMDFSHIFESDDIDDDDVEGVEEAFEFTNIKVVKELFSHKKKEANDLVKEGNKLFKRKEYKEAKEKYKKSLPIWKELAKGVAGVPEKEPGWFKSNDWALFIPFLSLPLLLCLSYQQSSVVRFVPKYKMDMEDIRKKTDKITRTGSIAKADILSALTTVIDYVEFQIKACDKPDGIVLESTASNAEILYEMLESVAESVEGEEDGDATPVKESASILDIAQGLID